MGDLLSEYSQHPFPRRLCKSGKCKQRKVQHDHGKGHCFSGCDRVNDLSKDQRRQKICYNGSDHSCQNSKRKDFLFFYRLEYNRSYLITLLHLPRLLPVLQKALYTPVSSSPVPHAYLSPFFHAPSRSPDPTVETDRVCVKSKAQFDPL